MLTRWPVALVAFVVLALCSLWCVKLQLERSRAISSLVDAGASSASLVPERDSEVLESLTQLRRFDHSQGRALHENAPFGRVPQRDTAWLAAAQPLAKAAGTEGVFWLQSGLSLIVLLALGAFLWRTLGNLSALLWGAGLTFLYPLNTYLFLPGISRASFALIMVGGAVLLGLLAIRGTRYRMPVLATAGILGGFALSTEVALAFPVLLAVGLGLLVAFFLPVSLWRSQDEREQTSTAACVWFAVLVLCGALVEVLERPFRFSSLKDSGTPWPYLLALLGLAGIFWSRRSGPRGQRWAVLLVAVLISLALPFALAVTEGWGAFAGGLGWSAIARGGAEEVSLGTWIFGDGSLLPRVASLLALLGLFVVVFTQNGAGGGLSRVAAAVALVSLGLFLLIRPGAWAAWEFLALIFALLSLGERSLPSWRLFAVVPGLVTGLACFLWANRPPASLEPTSAESEELLERHLASWLEPRVGADETVLAPPRLASGLAYFGKLKVLGTANPENHEGFATLLTLAAGPTMEQIQGTVSARRIRYLVMPDWDPFFKTCGQRYLGASRGASLMADEFEAWHLPNWVRPVPYQLPLGGAYEGRHLRLFEVVPEQSGATAAARLAEYFIETGENALASKAFEGLKKFPGDPGALAAKAQVAEAFGDAAEFRRSADALVTKLAVWGERPMPLDRRVSVATVLAKSDQNKLAAAQVTRCLRDFNRQNLTTLTTGGTYMLLVLAENYGVKFPDPALREVAMAALPPALRAQVGKP